MKDFKFFNQNVESIEDDPLYHLNVYENMALGLVSYCYRMNLTPVGYQHHFYETGPRVRNGVNKTMVITDLISHDYFESRHIRIKYELYAINPLTANEMTEHTFHLAEDVFNEVMRRYENV
jgi:hypothetical protein